MGNFWKHVGKCLASVGLGAVKASKWASDHPEVLQIVDQVVECATKSK